MKKILVLGGYGVFGRRICERLSSLHDMEIIVAGRSLEKASAFVSELTQAQSKLSALAIDAKNINDIKEENIFALINASGPYHEQDYCIAEYCIKHGIHYIDLADNRAFVVGIDILNEAAKAKNVLAVSGASTVPAISSMAIDHLRLEFSEIHEINYGASPGNQTDRGVSTVQAILSYVGKPFSALRDGKNVIIYGWQDLHREHYPQLGKRWMGNCNVPDLDLFPKHYPHLKTHKFYGGLELSILHLGLWLLSWPSRWGLIKHPDRFAKVLRTISLWFYPLGTNKGGMHVIVKGLDCHGKELERRWYLMGMDGHGPYIPTIPSILIAKALIGGALSKRGAMSCVGLFNRDAFMNEVSDLNIYAFESETLYKRYLGKRYNILPKAVQELHDYKNEVLYVGSGDVERGKNPFCRFICWIMSLPPTGKGQKVSVHFKQEGGAEHWTRHFNDKRYYSKQWDQNGRLYEKIGPKTFVFDIDATKDKLSLKLENLYSFGIPVGWIFKPRVIAEEKEIDGRFRFYIEAHLPFFGLLIKYDGWLERS